MQPVIPDAHEAVWQNVPQEPADELHRRHGQLFQMSPRLIVVVGETHLPVRDRRISPDSLRDPGGRGFSASRRIVRTTRSRTVLGRSSISFSTRREAVLIRYMRGFKLGCEILEVPSGSSLVGLTLLLKPAPQSRVVLILPIFQQIHQGVVALDGDQDSLSLAAFNSSVHCAISPAGQPSVVRGQPGKLFRVSVPGEEPVPDRTGR